jgi:HEAT repeat protein
LLESKDSRLVPALAKSLALVGDVRAVPALVERLARESDADARIAIVEALAAFADEPVAAEGLLTAIEDPVWKVRLSAAGAMGGSRDKRSVAALLEALRDPVHEVRLQAAWSLDTIEESP